MSGAVEVRLKPELHPRPRRVPRPAVPAKAATKNLVKSPELQQRKDEARRVDAPEDGSSSSCRQAPAESAPLPAPRKRRPKSSVVHKEGVARAVGKRRCAWITAFSEPLYVSFHDEEWGVPVHDDRKLFELLTLSGALSEFSWPTILNKRHIFRKLFDDFDPSSVAKFTENNVLSIKGSGSLLSEQKMRAVVENARQMLKVIEEFGSFSNYCWSFVNHKQITNGYRYAHQVPVRSPRAEAMSKDLMQRGFRCIGPTVVYSFMQAAGIVNDHLLSCFTFRHASNVDR